ncbi:thiol oxidoreductase [Mixta theicola]|uniref:Thiol oxidoreductase n=1 Tax=Mixta theicola TaxID=1458355 RepID=A0A2K1Q5J1_9GAMM|nr:di-heme oxidoredictase family protein [Mixta theicola]PNS10271.1 thiol oxidoreductase [Mixta theicola]GLR09539.1 thiol oxidoreductase [Mixta theicola]
MKKSAYLLICALGGSVAHICSAVEKAGGDFTTFHQDRASYEEIVWEKIAAAQQRAVSSGRGFVRQTWVVSPSLNPDVAGLGPTYNRPSCISCHPHNGRGQPPELYGEPMRSMLVRLSVPGLDTFGAPRPEPHYGDQLNEFGVPGVPGEGEARIEWMSLNKTLPDGTIVELRHPQVTFHKLAWGPLDNAVMTSLRVASVLYGLGLLEAVPEAEIMAIADEQRREGRGVAGTANRVWDVAKQRSVLGRFGWKANQPTVRQQIAAALLGDMGITTPLFPEPNCPPAQTACIAQKADTHPELSNETLDKMALYHYMLAVPARRDVDTPVVKHGEELFTEIGCASCHRSSLKTGDFPAFPALAGQIIHPYTDLLVHDMGEGLADGRPDGIASARQWRTPPLWGMGLLEKINEHTRLLHDGRARNPLEAILWHDGEAQDARIRFEDLSKADREAVISFLLSL